MTIGNWGCLLVAYQMWLQYHGIATLPPMELRAAFIAAGRYKTGYFSGGDLKAAFPDFVIDERWTLRSNGGDLTDQIVAYMVKHETPVVIRVDFRPATSIHDQHWVLAVGHEDGNLVIADPDQGDIVRLDERYPIAGGDILEALWLRPTGEKRAEPLGVDVSHHQLGVDYEALATKDDVTFAIVRYAHGAAADTMYKAHVDGLRGAGIEQIGAYAWLRHDQPIQDQIRTWHKLFTEKPVDFLAVDVEENELSAARVRVAIHALDRLGIYSIDYSSFSKWHAIMNNANHSHRVQWQSRYEATGTLAYGGHDAPRIWQYSQHGTLHGHRSIDLNLLLGDWPKAPEKEPIEPPVVVKPKINLLPYWKGQVGWAHNLKSFRGTSESNETVQTADLGDGKWGILKNRLMQRYTVMPYEGRDFIWQLPDSSPGNNRFYVTWFSYNGKIWNAAPICPVEMSIGETWRDTRTHYVQFYNLGNGAFSTLNSGFVTNWMTLHARHDSMQFLNGIVLDDVIEIGNNERHLMARNRTLVGWSRDHNDPHTPQSSGVSELHAPFSRKADPLPLPHYIAPNVF